MADADQSMAFYQNWLRFGPEDRRFPDGTVFVRDGEGTDLALRAGVPEPSRGWHFGFRWATPGSVRALGQDLAAAGVAVLEVDDDPAVVAVKFLDPDGYLIEVYWEA